MTIVSHEHKFIFLKSRKTAGTSVSFLFSQICGSNDILALSQDVVTKFGIERQNVKRNLSSMSLRSWALHMYFVKKNIGRKPIAEIIWPTFKQHMTVAQIKEALGDKIWNSYYKFTIERNPYDRLVSFYYWRMHRFGIAASFKDCALAVLGKKSSLNKYFSCFSNKPFYLDKNELCVDNVILFEDMQNGISNVFRDIGLAVPVGIEIPNFKKGIRKSRDYRSYFSQDILAAAKRMFETEEELFGYEF